MSRRTPDNPLTDAEIRALVALAERLARTPDDPYAKPCRNSTTLYALSDRGLVETRLARYRADVEAKITDDGLALLATMGD